MPDLNLPSGFPETSPDCVIPARSAAKGRNLALLPFPPQQTGRAGFVLSVPRRSGHSREGGNLSYCGPTTDSRGVRAPSQMARRGK